MRDWIANDGWLNGLQSEVDKLLQMPHLAVEATHPWSETGQEMMSFSFAFSECRHFGIPVWSLHLKLSAVIHKQLAGSTLQNPNLRCAVFFLKTGRCYLQLVNLRQQSNKSATRETFRNNRSSQDWATPSKTLFRKVNQVKKKWNTLNHICVIPSNGVMMPFNTDARKAIFFFIYWLL